MKAWRKRNIYYIYRGSRGWYTKHATSSDKMHR